MLFSYFGTFHVYDIGPYNGQLRPPRPDQMCPNSNYGMFYDLGVYGTPGKVKRCEPYDAVDAMRKMEKYVGYVNLFCNFVVYQDI